MLQTRIRALRRSARRGVDASMRKITRGARLEFREWRRSSWLATRRCVLCACLKKYTAGREKRRGAVPSCVTSRPTVCVNIQHPTPAGTIYIGIPPVLKENRVSNTLRIRFSINFARSLERNSITILIAFEY